jgi:hypothetical protein
MNEDKINVSVNPHDMRFLRDRTGADSNQEVIRDALQLYKAAVLGAMNGETVSMVKEAKDGVLDIAQLELPSGRFAYAGGNADIPRITCEEVNKTLRGVLAATAAKALLS